MADERDHHAEEADHAGGPPVGGDRSGPPSAEPDYDELRRIAADYLRRERPGHTLQPTALVHEALIRLGPPDGDRWNNRDHYVATVARAMRRILVDHARARRAEKRGGDRGRAGIDVDVAGATERGYADVLALEDALVKLEGVHERQARVVELRFFGGCSVAESAAYLGVSERTIELDWSVARAWLRRELGGDA